MGGQSQIHRRLSQPGCTARVKRLIDENPDQHRTWLADRLCDEFGFSNPRGQRQRSSCLKSLRKLEARGCFVLPSPRREAVVARPRRLDSSLPPPRNVPGAVDAIRELNLILVESEEHRLIWNSMLAEEHPQGEGPLVGRQLRYLIASEHGWLGGLGFASSALHLGARDFWIGWDFETRQAHLDRVVGMARFLIRPSVFCKNLASRILGLAMGRMAQDFETIYGYQPWLVETFVDTSQFSGTCYKAANWTRVGVTQGRGRQDRENNKAESIKDIYLYVLAKDFRTRLGLPEHAGLGPLPLGVGLESDTWAKLEFGGAPLGDERLSKRLVRSASLQAENPTLSFPRAAEGVTALVKGHYRLIDQPDDSAVTMENILAPHRTQTIRRMKAEKTVLCIQDGTDLNYNGAAECDGLGVIGKNQTGARSLGLHLHSTLVVTDEGLPLGVLRADCSAPVPRDQKDKRRAYKIPLEQKDSYKWILSMRDCEAVAAETPTTRVVQVMDREADFFELFDDWGGSSRRTDLLVRAQYNRRTTAGPKLFDGVRAAETRLRIQLHIGRQSARPKKSKQKARARRRERVATMALRYEQIELRPPFYHKDKESVSLWTIHMLEEEPPPGVEPLEWFLLTTMEIETPEQAERLVNWYCLRWRIEDWHRVLKTGCRVEKLRNTSAERLKRAIAIYLVIAWRVMLMTLLGREVPDLPPQVLFSEIELEVLEAFARSRRDLKSPARLGDATHLVARLGGYLGRKNDYPPGHEAIWVGYTKLEAMSAGVALERQFGRQPP